VSGMGGAPPAGPHGGDGARLAARLGVAVDAVLDLSASLNPVAPDPVPALARHLDAARRYPDVAAVDALVADAMGAPRDEVVVTAGGSAAIALLAVELGPGRVDDPDFSLYRRHLAGVDPAGPRWRSNPHNPTGRLAPPDEHADVWDEAFYPLATGAWTRGDGQAVVGSLTKLLACPGLRVGYVRSPDRDLVARLGRARPAWGIDGPTAAALPELLAAVDLAGWREQVAALRAELVALLVGHGLRPRPSDACFVLVDNATGLRDALAPHGVLVRDASSFGLPDAVRVAVPDAAGLTRLATALDRCWPMPAGEPLIHEEPR
jgi:histidinol-phosphate/aromatic aminotransferase/cobyric acid decarboxylase-like protein